MPSFKYNPFYIERTPKPTLPNPPKAPLHLFSFRNFFNLFTPSLFSYIFNNITIPNTSFTYFTAFSPTLIPTTLNRHIC